MSTSETLDEYRAALKRMGIEGAAANAFLISHGSSSQVVMASVIVPGALADTFADELLMYAASVSMNDAEKGTSNETEVFSLAGERAFVCRPPNQNSLTGDVDEKDDRAAAAAALWPSVHLNITINIATLAAEVPGASQRDALAEILLSSWTSAGGNHEQLPDFEMHTNSTPLNWIKRVEESYKPVRIVDTDASSSLSPSSMWVVPTWQQDQVRDDETATRVLLEPGLAFGTGEHPTTKLCLRWLLRSSAYIAAMSTINVLDIGTGSGILGCASALLFGDATSVFAIDVDPLAVIASRRNAEYNSVSDRMRVCACGVDGTASADVAPEDSDADSSNVDDACAINALMRNGEFDVVIANILQPTLLVLEPVIARATRRGGSMCLSGILREDQADAIVNAYGKHFDDVRVIGDDSEWCVVTGTRNSVAAMYL